MNAVKLKFEVKYKYKNNKRSMFFLFRKINEFKNKNTIHEYKNVDFILSVVWDYIKAMILKVMYFLCCVYLPMYYTKSVNGKNAGLYVLYNIFFLNILFGNLKDSYLFSYGYDRHFCFSFLKFNMKEYVFRNFYYDVLKQIVTFGIGVLVLFRYYKINLNYIPVILIFTMTMRFVSEAVHIYHFQKKDDILCSKIGYDIVILVLCAIGYLPLVYKIKYIFITHFLDIRLGALAILICLILNKYMKKQEFVSFSFMERFKEKKDISTIFSKEMKRGKKNSDSEGLMLENIVLDNLNQKMDITYLNKVFFIRYHAYFFNVVLLRCIFAVIVSSITTIYLYRTGYGNTQSNVLLPLMFIEVFLLSNADQFYRKIYECCDKVFTDFSVYFNWKIQKENIFVRLKKCLKDNTVILLFFILPLWIYQILADSSMSAIFVLTSAVVLFFVYTLEYQTFVYYLLQPYGKKEIFSWKNWMASILNLPLYICIFHFSTNYIVFVIFMLVDICLLGYFILKLVPKYQIKAFRKN